MRGRGSTDAHLGTEDLGNDEVACVSRSRLRGAVSSVGVLTSPVRSTGRYRQGDEEVGLSHDKIAAARAALTAQRMSRLGSALRHQRDRVKASCWSTPSRVTAVPVPNENNRIDLLDEPEFACTVIGLAIAFPPSDRAVARTYVAVRPTTMTTELELHKKVSYAGVVHHTPHQGGPGR